MKRTVLKTMLIRWLRGEDSPVNVVRLKYLLRFEFGLDASLRRIRHALEDLARAGKVILVGSGTYALGRVITDALP